MQIGRGAISPIKHRQEVISEVVRCAIASFGFYRAIPELMRIVHAKGSAATADPRDEDKAREFFLWAQAVRDACANQVIVQTFEDRLDFADDIRARGLGISLGEALY